MKFVQGNKKVSVAPKVYTRKKGDKKKFIALLNNIGYSGDVNKAWKAYLEAK